MIINKKNIPEKSNKSYLKICDIKESKFPITIYYKILCYKKS